MDNNQQRSLYMEFEAVFDMAEFVKSKS